MKHIIILISFVLFTTCSNNNLENENCRFLLDIPVDVSINLNLTQFQHIKSSGNSAYIPNVGNKGIIIARIGFNYFAWDAADPNHIQSSCSLLVDPSNLQLKNYGLSSKCQCIDENEYSFANGLPLNNGELRCGLRNYRVDVNQNILRISN